MNAPQEKPRDLAREEAEALALGWLRTIAEGVRTAPPTSINIDYMEMALCAIGDAIRMDIGSEDDREVILQFLMSVNARAWKGALARSVKRTKEIRLFALADDSSMGIDEYLMFDKTYSAAVAAGAVRARVLQTPKRLWKALDAFEDAVGDALLKTCDQSRGYASGISRPLSFQAVIVGLEARAFLIGRDEEHWAHYFRLADQP